jgi:hypothetical protein
MVTAMKRSQLSVNPSGRPTLGNRKPCQAPTYDFCAEIPPADCEAVNRKIISECPAPFFQRALDALGHTAEEVSGRGKRQEVVRAREVLMTLGVERYGLRVTEMAAILGARYNSACLWSRRGATRRQEDRTFAEKLDGVDAIIASSPPEGTEWSAENV